MSKIDDGGFAFPRGPDDKSGWRAEYGMTLRDWFAGQALVALGTWMPVPVSGYPSLASDETIAARAEIAYRQADAMLAARKAGAE